MALGLGRALLVQKKKGLALGFVEGYFQCRKIMGPGVFTCHARLATKGWIG